MITNSKAKPKAKDYAFIKKDFFQCRIINVPLQNYFKGQR